jgi:nucleotide-binding universal stress UspA family protein
MSPDMKNLLCCIDASIYAASVSDLSAWAAKRLSRGVEVLHIIQRKDAVAARKDLSGSIGLGVKTDLLEELTRIDEAEGMLAIERGRLLLDAAVKRLRDAGVGDVTRLHRHGGIVETIVEREQDADLIVIGKRGASGDFAIDHMGSKVERVVRASIKPIFVAPHEFRPPRSVVIAFDGSALATRAIDLVERSPLFDGMEIHVVTAGVDQASKRSKLEQAALRLKNRAEGAIREIVDGQPEEAISAYLAKIPDAMLVMGAYGHTPLRRLIVGSTTTAMIRTVDVPILLVR